MKRILLSLLCLLLSTSVFSQSLQLVKDIEAGSNSSYPVILGTLPNGVVLFYTISTQSGTEFWSSDGTAPGTYRFKDMKTIYHSGLIKGTGVVLNGKMFVVCDDVVHGEELWVTDGTDTGTHMLKDIYPGSVSGAVDYTTNYFNNALLYNGKVYFAADDSVHGNELWSTDGTEAGTRMVWDIDRKSSSRNDGPRSLTIAMGKIFFRAKTKDTGYELWYTDGTAVGTRMVKDLYPGSKDGIMGNLHVLNDKLYFKGKENDSIGEELYSYDGNAITLVKDINPAIGQGSGEWKNGSNQAVVEGKLYFDSYDTIRNAKGVYHLWVTDGTTTGTHKIIIPAPNEEGELPTMAGTVDNKLLFSPRFTGAHFKKQELWVSDGTTGGTRIVKELDGNSGIGINLPPSTTRYFKKTIERNSIANGKYYFFGKQDKNSQEYTMWGTDGTEAGTFKPFGDSLYGVIDIYINGNDVWISTATIQDSLGVELYYTNYLPTTSIADTRKPADFFTVYPNPADNGKVTVKIDGTHDKGFLLVTDVTGRMVYNQSVNKTDHEVYLDLNNNAKGMYYITLKLGSAEMTHSVVLQ